MDPVETVAFRYRPLKTYGYTTIKKSKTRKKLRKKSKRWSG